MDSFNDIYDLPAKLFGIRQAFTAVSNPAFLCRSSKKAKDKAFMTLRTNSARALTAMNLFHMD